MSKWTACAIVLAGIFIPSLLLEILLRIKAIDTSPSVIQSPAIFITDESLGIRPNPNYPSHDSRGWRNPKALNRADLVALGDSQTFGTGARPEESWPAVVDSRLRISIYQMAFGSYGPAHYIKMLDEVLKLQPKALVLALYLGNDVTDTYSLIYQSKQDIQWPFGEWRTSDSTLQKSIQTAEKIDPQHLRHKYLDCQVIRWIPAPAFQKVSDVLSLNPLEPLEARGNPLEQFFQSLGHISELIRISFSGYQQMVAYRNKRKIYPEPVCVEYKWENKRIVFSPAYRLLPLDDTDPRVSEGKKLVLISLEFLRKTLHGNGIQFFVLLIPTKELVFKPFVEGKVNASPYLTRLWSAETEFRESVSKFLKSRGVPVIDSLAYLRTSLERGEIPYPNSTGLSVHDADGHPNATGYRQIANSVIEAFEELKIK